MSSKRIKIQGDLSSAQGASSAPNRDAVQPAESVAELATGERAPTNATAGDAPQLLEGPLLVMVVMVVNNFDNLSYRSYKTSQKHNFDNFNSRSYIPLLSSVLTSNVWIY